MRKDGKMFGLKAHRLILCVIECMEHGDPELAFDLYFQYSQAGFESDHRFGCSSLCINPDHVHWLHVDEHRQITRDRGEGIYK